MFYFLEPDTPVASVPERILQEVWASTAYRHRGLSTVQGRTVRVVSPGRLNKGPGPDFEDARLRIDGVLLAGAVELHILSSIWNRHGHQRDPAYNRVVLHVVLERDRDTGRLYRSDGTPLDELVLQPYLEVPLRRLIHTFARPDPKAFPCQSSWPDVPSDLRRRLVRELASARLTRRTRAIRLRLDRGCAPADLLRERAFRVLGYPGNAEPMARLGTFFPPEAAHAYPTTLALYEALLATAQPTDASAHGTTPALLWTRGPARPANRLSNRLWTAACWLGPDGWLRTDPLRLLNHALTGHTPIQGIEALLDHPPHPVSGARIGQARKHRILCDAILPALPAFSSSVPSPARLPDARALLDQLPAPDDRIIRAYTDAHFGPASAFEAQGLYELHSMHCERRRCLSCPVGRYLLGSS